jgi:hypothetical protein
MQALSDILKFPKWFDLVQWVDLLQGPNAPIFVPGTSFTDQGKSFWSVFFTSGVLAGISILLDTNNNARSFTLSPVARLCITGIAAFSALYCLGVSRLFGIRISIRQGFFTIGFLIVPWIPIFSFVLFLGRHFAPLAVIFVLMCYVFSIYIVWSVAKGISVVSGASRLRAFLSLCILVVVIATLGVHSLLST